MPGFPFVRCAHLQNHHITYNIAPTGTRQHRRKNHHHHRRRRCCRGRRRRRRRRRCS